MSISKVINNAENQLAAALVARLQTFQKSKKNRFKQASLILQDMGVFYLMVQKLRGEEEQAIRAEKAPLPRRRPMPTVAGNPVVIQQ